MVVRLAGTDVRAYQEWMVTGTLPSGMAYESELTTELQARSFVARAAAFGPWPDGPHLHRHTVLVSEWVEVES